MIFSEKNKKKIKKWIVNKGAFVAFWVMPFTIIPIFSFYEQEWLGRIITLSIVLAIGTSFLFWYSLYLKVKKGAKLDRPGHEKSKKRFELIARIFMFSIALFVAYLSVQFTRDVSSLIKEKKIVLVRGKVIMNSTVYGASFLYQSITLETENNREENYSLYYSSQPRIKKGGIYQFKVLPKSEVILEAKRIKLKPSPDTYIKTFSSKK